MIRRLVNNVCNSLVVVVVVVENVNNGSVQV